MPPVHGTVQPTSIYLALYAISREQKYHSGIVLTDSNANTVLHHAKQDPSWTYAVQDFEPENSLTLIALILLGKIKNESKVLQTFEKVPADGRPSLRTGAAFACNTWTKDVLFMLEQEGELVLPADVDSLENQAKTYGTTYSNRATGGGGATVVNRFRKFAPE
ncbi:hypothetical protein E4U43_005385 [Claviceps pusilla]|uniref:Uncharacterized protein n=1 Tax=Claviceps pusilla TaxID=123648 RepID=A0A9P7SW78_9HYPO|nr:hypothetical protein E4U43_005385 [Claviceps pusilla]